MDIIKLYRENAREVVQPTTPILLPVCVTFSVVNHTGSWQQI